MITDPKDLFELEYTEGEVVNDEWQNPYYTIIGVKDESALPENLVIPSWVSEEYDDTYIKVIGEGAFKGLRKLRTLTIEGTSEIAISAFEDCSGLEKITFESFLPKDIGSDAFKGCTALKAIDTFAKPLGKRKQLEDITPSAIEDYCAIYFGNEFSNPLFYAHNLFVDGQPIERLEVPEKVTAFHRYAFCGISVKSLKLHSKLKEIGAYSFMGCTALKSVELPQSLVRLEKFAFKGCTALETVTLFDGIRAFDGSAFEGCNKLKYSSFGGAKYLGNKDNPFVVLVSAEKDIVCFTPHPSTRAIASGAFKDCLGLTEFVGGEGLIRIGAGAFEDCTALRKVYFPSTLSYIGRRAFSGCEIKEMQVADMGAWCNVYFDVPFEYRNPNPIATATLSDGENVVIPSSVQTVQAHAFAGCKNIKSLVISEGVRSIGERAFYNCPNLESIVLPSSLRECGYGVFESCRLLASAELPPMPYIECGTFRNCTALKEVRIGVGTKAIIDGAFGGCTALKTVEIPGSVKKIGRGAFRDCTALEEINIPDSVETIGHDAFSGCVSLKRAVIPKGVDSIGLRAFEGCSSLEEVVLPKTLLHINNGAFKGCKSLKKIELPDSLRHVDSDAFEDCESLEIIASDKLKAKLKL